ncbi:hypothetical protein AB0C10_15965 [Microbispora amethystogenes]|uniref:hypothetical protein n=1 Tax=Microbispora amethystogenes TaxID=1427754 RepID=UPI0033E66423
MKPGAMDVGRCLCGEPRYVSKKRAKAAARDLHPGRTMRPYQCGQYWHYAPPAKAAARTRKDGMRASLVIVDEAVSYMERMSA